MKLRKILCAAVVLVLFLAMIPAGWGAENEDPEIYIQKMLNFYRCYRSDAREEIDGLLSGLEKLDAKQAEAWRKIMDSWRYTVEDMELNYNSLPDGLPEDDSLGIVIMGYGLNEDGSIREELQSRLEVGLAAAQKYPDAYVIVTGGPTALDTDDTEAGQMQLWLLEHGLPEERIIAEPCSYSTAQNALNVYRLLNKSHPQIQAIAVVTSDYHIYRSIVDFSTVSHYYGTVSAGREIPVVGHACCDPGYERREELSSHAADIAAITGVELEYQRATALYGGAAKSNVKDMRSHVLRRSVSD